MMPINSVDEHIIHFAKGAAINLCVRISYELGRWQEHYKENYNVMNFKDTRASFYVGYCIPRILISANLRQEHGGYIWENILEDHIMSKEMPERDPKTAVEVAYIYADTLKGVLRGIELLNVYDICSSAICHYPYPQPCNIIQSRPVCESCQERLTLVALKPPSVLGNETASKRKERQKLTPSLRWIILERDGFRCRTCGVSPISNPKVILHVDHIVPISKGGKTKPENLHTMCSTCNIGKGSKHDPVTSTLLSVIPGSSQDIKDAPGDHIDLHL